MAKSAISWQNPQFGASTKSGYRYPWTTAKWYRYRSSGTGTHSQKNIGSGTGTDTSNSPDFFTLALLSPNSYTDSIGTLINY